LIREETEIWKMWSLHKGITYWLFPWWPRKLRGSDSRWKKENPSFSALVTLAGQGQQPLD
jgi:hypothetical protein